MEMLIAWATSQVAAYVGGSIAVVILTWILKKVDTAKIRKMFYDFFFKIGAGVSKFFNNWKYTKAFWENTLEPWFIGLLDMIFGGIMQGLFDGLRSDNKKKR